MRGAHKVLGDRSQLQQVIVNLRMNRCAGNGPIRRRKTQSNHSDVAPDSATLCCSVEDSGRGIDPQHLALLFKNFFTTNEGVMGMDAA